MMMYDVILAKVSEANVSKLSTRVKFWQTWSTISEIRMWFRVTLT